MEKIILDPFREVIVLFFYLCVASILLMMLLIFSEFKIYIKNVQLSTKKIKGKIIHANYDINIGLYILKKIPILKIELTKPKLQNLKTKKYIKNININRIQINKLEKKQIKKIYNYMPKIEYINLYMDIGLNDAVYTSYVVACISIILGIALKKQLSKGQNSKYIINPIYSGENLLKLNLECIIKLKLIHIIYIIYILNKKRRVDNNVRTSNRRPYGYSYE